ncbi:tetratricopeptide repeat protein [Adhaeretor mobilis]|uniref:tetratricopeptide repeat protein n=1 Tax=Adhaeretor mobilis TaxID=1930276 RepID=UPI00119E0FB3|nr:hypothetical protein [Adhaeretor mobilis]
MPSDDNEVLETLPRSLLSGGDELTSMRQQLADDPKNLDLARTVASRYLQMGKQDGDPRFYGYARAALGPWWDAADAPADILKLRAKLKETDHDYDEALADLWQFVKQEPRDAQAWIEISNILRVQGKYDEALEARNKLSEFARSVEIMYSNVPLLAVTGNAEAALDLIQQKLPEARQRYPGTVPWMLTMRAEISRALGRDEQAEESYLEGLGDDPGPSYLMRAYTDFLLDRDRANEALELVRDHTADTGSLLRAAIAAKQVGDEKLADEYQSQLENRFQEIRLRGSEPHGRFESRYALELENVPLLALELAQKNWQKQKEARDTRNLLEAAIAAKRPDAAKPVIEFLEKYGTQDVQFDKLLNQIEGK